MRKNNDGQGALYQGFWSLAHTKSRPFLKWISRRLNKHLTVWKIMETIVNSF